MLVRSQIVFETNRKPVSIGLSLTGVYKTLENEEDRGTDTLICVRVGSGVGWG